jgi:hypothetical protein
LKIDDINLKTGERWYNTWELEAVKWLPDASGRRFKSRLIDFELVIEQFKLNLKSPLKQDLNLL